MIRTVALLLLLLFSGCRASAAPAEYICRITPQAPVIDGRLDDACWKDAAAPPQFYELGVGGKPVKNATRVRFLMDGEALYAGIEAATTPGKLPFGRERGRDGKTWYDDCVEIFLCPSFVDPTVTQLCLTAYGAMMDLRRGPGIAPDAAIQWNGAWQAVATAREGGWSAEVRIPWSDFGVKPPPRGWVWRVKVGLVAKGYPNAMWPRNESQGFANPECWGYLIFGDPNLQENPGFESGPPEKGLPKEWVAAYHAKEGQGICSITGEDRASGKWAGRLEKTDDIAWFPVFYTRELSVQPGSTYELSAWVKCDREFTMRYNLLGKAGAKRSTRLPATKGWQRVSLEAVIPENGVEAMSVGWQLLRTRGVILLDDVVIRRLNEVTVTQEAVAKPHPYHRLEELASRTSFKTYALLQGADGWFQGDRVIYKDTSTGIETWMLTRSAGTSTRHSYMEISPWNADGSYLLFNSGQLGKGSLHMRADGSAWRYLDFYASSPIWDRRDPARVYYRVYRGRDKTDLWDLAVGNVLTGAREVTRRFDGDIALWPMSQDGEKLLVREAFPDPDGKMRSRLWIMNRDGKEGLMLDPGGWVHQSWFTKAPDYSIEFEWEGQTPPGQYCISTDGKVRKLFDQTSGHRAHSPDGRWVAVMAGCAIRDKRTGELKAISDEPSDHQTWETDPNWYCTSSGRYMRRVIAFGNETTQLLGAHNTALKHSTYWSEAHPEMSPDGTKLGYASSMMGDIEFYWMVMRRPDPPQNLRARREGKRVHLSWEPGRYHKETKGYLVYRSGASGEAGELLTPEPIAALTWSDTPDGLAYYRVTSVEHSGLEGLPSNEVCAFDPWEGPAAVYVEAETGHYPKPAVEVFDASASGLYAVTLGKLRAPPPMTLGANLPKAGEYRLWIRARGTGSLRASAGGSVLGEVRCEGKAWQWLAYPTAVKLDKGEASLSLEATVVGLSVDRMLLTDAPGYRPAGLGGADRQAPAKPAGLKAEAAGRYAVRLSWTPAREPDVAYYNVYAASTGDVAAVQERLVGSPAEPRFVDWGLKPGTTYTYRVTSVDRAGNESPASDAVQAKTEALPARLVAGLKTTWNTTLTPSVELSFTLPADGEVVVWAKVQSLDGSGRAPIRLELDGKELGRQSIPFSYISIGHGGPVLKTWLWSCFRPERANPAPPMGFPVKAGGHRLTLTADPAAKVLFEEFVITNDLGFVPEGTVNFRVEP